MINIQIQSGVKPKPSRKIISDTAEAVFAHFDLQQEQEISIVITDDTNIRRLNSEYLGIDEPTDVLSFSANEIDPETNRIYLGDIIISLPRAIEQANKAGHSYISEIQLLIIHGSLHLLGYDHIDDKSKTEMWSVQKAILDVLGIKIFQLPEN